MSDDPFDLERFVTAQNGRVVGDATAYEAAIGELRAGRKHTHWIWFVFPQLAGLGTSDMAIKYAIANSDEARAYVAHPLLGARLRECCEAMLAAESDSATAILGTPDDLKLRSSMTLFAAYSDDPIFQQVLDRFFDEMIDQRTIELLG
ncbi:MAG: DUF1810 domain-containing protein [Microthrixaceae bacterium]